MYAVHFQHIIVKCFLEIAGRDYKKQPCDENDKNGFKFPHFNNQLIHDRNRNQIFHRPRK